MDCGLFAIAFAYELADGNDPSDVSFDQGKMRQHLVQCLEKGRLEAFPRQLNTARFNKDKHMTLTYSVIARCPSVEILKDITKKLAVRIN